ncbi:MAG TPA: response regulator [Spirochaetota bacterium]|nr:response regulator [Spirochaetota bacterium]
MENIKDKKLLIVEDSQVNIEILVAALQDDYKLSVARDGKQALKAVRQVRPDLVLLDIMMPEMDGFETCTKLKEQPDTKEIPVIFLTGLTKQENKTMGFEVGGVDYITKPFELPEVRARINTHLALRQAREELTMHNKKLDELVKMKTRTIQVTNKLLEELLYPGEVMTTFHSYFKLLAEYYDLNNIFIYKKEQDSFAFVCASGKDQSLLKEDPGLQQEIDNNLTTCARRRSMVATTIHYYKTVLFPIIPEEDDIYVIVIADHRKKLNSLLVKELVPFNKYIGISLRDHAVMHNLDNFKASIAEE